MKTLLGWLALIAVISFAYFIVSRVIRFLFGIGRAKVPLHDRLTDVTEDVAAASIVTAAIGAGAASFLAPTGLLAVGAALGFVSVPLIVQLVPYLLTFAFAVAAISALAKLFAKSRRRRTLP